MKQDPRNAPRKHLDFQSDQAATAAISSREPEVPEEPKPAAIDNSGSDDGEPQVLVVVDRSEENKLVKIRPRETQTRVRIGRSWYSFIAGKDCLVPKHVARLLEEKGLL